MYRDTTYNLWFHDDVEVGDVLGSPIVRRTGPHEEEVRPDVTSLASAVGSSTSIATSRREVLKRA